MAMIKRGFWGLFLLLTLLWLAATPDVFSASGLFTWRSLMLQYSGVLAMGCFSVAMFLAARPRWPEHKLGGLDKMYRLHKWLGISALILSIAHWFIVEAPKWAVQAEWIARPQRGPRAPIDNPLQSFLSEYRHLAEGVGEWAFYAAILLIAISLIQRIPYGTFHSLHRFFPPLYLGLVLHTIVLTRFSYWTTPLGLVLSLLMIGGTYGAVLSMFRLIGSKRTTHGKVVELEPFPGVRSLRATAVVGPEWAGHKPGQFAFAMSNPKEGPHPYTIASAWDPETRRITFITKALGDHTSHLLDTLKVGTTGTIEGPYGCFTFDDDKPLQIWIGGGIGITPFIARMEHRVQHGITRRIHLFHSTADVDETALDHLRDLAARADVTLHLVIEARDGHLTGDQIRKAVPDWTYSSIWFCGPTGFGDAIRADFAAEGFPVRKDFHHELFQMR